MTDGRIEISDFYTLKGDYVHMGVIASKNPAKLMFQPNTEKIRLDYVPFFVPKTVKPSDIKSISDIERLGGKLIEGGSQDTTYQALGITTVEIVSPAR